MYQDTSKKKVKKKSGKEIRLKNTWKVASVKCEELNAKQKEENDKKK